MVSCTQPHLIEISQSIYTKGEMEKSIIYRMIADFNVQITIAYLLALIVLLMIYALFWK